MTDYIRTAKRLLEKYNSCRIRKLELFNRLCDTRNDIKTASLSAAPVHGGGTATDRMVNRLTKIFDIEKMLEKQINDVGDTLMDILELLNVIEPLSKERRVLELRYVEGLEWKHISEAMGLSEPQCFRYCNRAIKGVCNSEKGQEILRKYHNFEN